MNDLEIKYFKRIMDLEGERDLLRDQNEELVKALKTVEDWFEKMKADQYEKLTHKQTLESASKNWDVLLQKPLDMAVIKQALKSAEDK